MPRYASWSAVADLAAMTGLDAARAQVRAEVGVLARTARSSTGFIVGSTKYLSCRFNRRGRDELYRGTIAKFGLDIGTTKQTTIAWAVLAPTINLPPRSLNGTYGGVGGAATVGLGMGANALVGGSGHSVILQPLSVQAQQGLKLAAGIETLQLRANY